MVNSEMMDNVYVKCEWLVRIMGFKYMLSGFYRGLEARMYMRLITTTQAKTLPFVLVS